ncbi:MAG: hypothetical protein KKA73_25345, partial [Chloroflexi bacterium]|nr:hypothetical protein [Chloroflexota bacterium]MBU1751022.1 hypothetical protein [Chloroflexota bacterium]
PAALRHGRWEAFVARPSLLRLLDLWELAADPAERAALMPHAAAYLQDYGTQPPAGLVGTLGIGDGLEQPAWIGPAVLAHAYLLAGDWAAAQRLVARGQVLGWSSTENAQGLVVAASLVLLSGQSLGALPANLAQVWQWGLQYSVVVWGEDKTGVIQRLERAYAEQFPLVRLSAEQQARLLAWCLDVAQQRANAIVGNQHRRSYGQAAVLIVAGAEVLRRRGDPTAAEALVSAVRQRFPRHRAFQAEMDTALRRRSPGG